MDYSCGKFGDCVVSAVLVFIVRTTETDRQTDRHRRG